MRQVLVLTVAKGMSPPHDPLFEVACAYSHVHPYGCQLNGPYMAEVIGSPGAVEQRQALMSLYEANNGPHWRANDLWGEGDPCWYFWYGVGCNAAGQVVRLALPENNLTGSLSPSIQSLVHLQVLDLRTISLRRPEFGTKGTYRLAHGGWMAGPWANRLTSLPSLAGLLNLRELRVDGNLLSALPDTLYLFGSLHTLSAAYNRIREFPKLGSFQGGTPGLHSLALDHNQIRGNLTDFQTQFRYLQQLQVLTWRDNQIFGEFQERYLLPLVRLRVLDISHNLGIRGEFPRASIAEWSELQLISLYNTSMSGYLADLCLDLPFCYTHNFDVHPPMANASGLPDIIKDVLNEGKFFSVFQHCHTAKTPMRTESIGHLGLLSKVNFRSFINF